MRWRSDEEMEVGVGVRDGVRGVGVEVGMRG